MAAVPTAAVSSCAYRLSLSSRDPITGIPIPQTSTSVRPLQPTTSKPLRASLSTSRATSHALAEADTGTSPPPRRRTFRPHRPKRGTEKELHLGYETWSLPPSVAEVKDNKPKLAYGAASLAYLGDCVFELYARRHFLYPPKSIDVYNERVSSLVRCESQDALLKKILQEDFITEEERDILQWGRNIGSRKTRTRKRAGVAVYRSASSLETLIGHLYLTNMKRLEEVMSKLGFSTDASAERIIEKASL